ncbi:MAG: ribokinase [Eubacteriales bacterium]|nr:ribokinase [Eubacteriales bacterium]
MSVFQVIGSLNVDMTVLLPRFHAAGETITGENFKTYLGGKGGNQATALAKLGADVQFIGMLGEDSYAQLYLDSFKELNVDTRYIGKTEEASTGIALIEVNQNGENRIAVVPGANALCDYEFVNRAQEESDTPEYTLLQLEIPLYSCQQAAKQASRAGSKVILDPAPAVPLNDSFLSDIDIITPNESELRLLTGLPTGTVADAEKAAKNLLSRGVKAVVAKLGSRGCLYVDSMQYVYCEGFKVDTVDTTAAGDSFNAGLAYALSQKWDLKKCLAFANAVGALSTTKAGAQGAMPTLKQALELIG